MPPPVLLSSVVDGLETNDRGNFGGSFLFVELMLLLLLVLLLFVTTSIESSDGFVINDRTGRRGNEKDDAPASESSDGDVVTYRI